MYLVELLRVGLCGTLVWFQYILAHQLFHFMHTMRYGFLPCYMSMATVAVLLCIEYDKLLVATADSSGIEKIHTHTCENIVSGTKIIH